MAKIPEDLQVSDYHDRKHDKGKLRYSLLPWRSLAWVVKVLEHGAEKYAPDGWKTVPDARARYHESLLRHIAAIQEGEVLDSGPKGSGLPHLAHVACNALYLLWLEHDDYQ
jgi:hypothetical protein